MKEQTLEWLFRIQMNWFTAIYWKTFPQRETIHAGSSVDLSSRSQEHQGRTKVQFWDNQFEPSSWKSRQLPREAAGAWQQHSVSNSRIRAPSQTWCGSHPLPTGLGSSRNVLKCPAEAAPYWQMKMLLKLRISPEPGQRQASSCCVQGNWRNVKPFEIQKFNLPLWVQAFPPDLAEENFVVLHLELS